MKITHTVIAPKPKAPGHRTYFPADVRFSHRANHHHLEAVREARVAQAIDEGFYVTA